MNRREPVTLASDDIAVLGEATILLRQLVAVACSARCPASLVLPAYDLAGAVRTAAVPTIGGFHTPIERDCLHYLLQGSQPVVICPARSVANMRPKPDWQQPLADGRLLIASPFPATARRPTRALSEARNQFVATQCAAALVIHAAPGGATARWAELILELNKPLWVLAAPENDALLARGARPILPDDVAGAAWFA